MTTPSDVRDVTRRRRECARVRSAGRPAGGAIIRRRRRTGSALDHLAPVSCVHPGAGIVRRPREESDGTEPGMAQRVTVPFRGPFHSIPTPTPNQPALSGSDAPREPTGVFGDVHTATPMRPDSGSRLSGGTKLG